MNYSIIYGKSLSIKLLNLPILGLKTTLQVPVLPLRFLPTIISIMPLSLVSEL